LIENAVKHTMKGGIMIVIDNDPQKNTVSFKIKDSG
jgi:signal transduction histidine kinase